MLRLLSRSPAGLAKPPIRSCLRLRRSASTHAPAPAHSIYVSRSTDPYFNLTLEDWYAVFVNAKVCEDQLTSGMYRLFRHKSPEKPLLLLYRDDPCVVIGRNQNPWKEVNMRAARERGIPFIRRHSGGGTVYHVRPPRPPSPPLCQATFGRGMSHVKYGRT